MPTKKKRGHPIKYRDTYHKKQRELMRKSRKKKREQWTFP